MAHLVGRWLYGTAGLFDHSRSDPGIRDVWTDHVPEENVSPELVLCVRRGESTYVCRPPSRRRDADIVEWKRQVDQGCVGEEVLKMEMSEDLSNDLGGLGYSKSGSWRCWFCHRDAST